MIKKIRIEEKAIVQKALSFLIGHHLQSAGVSQALAWVIALNMTSLHSLFIKKFKNSSCIPTGGPDVV